MLNPRDSKKVKTSINLTQWRQLEGVIAIIIVGEQSIKALSGAKKLTKATRPKIIKKPLNVVSLRRMRVVALESGSAARLFLVILFL